MKIEISTLSGASYSFDEEEMVWQRVGDVPIINWAKGNVSEHVWRGRLVEWPVIVMGRRMMFDDLAQGTVYTTPVVYAHILELGPE